MKLISIAAASLLAGLSVSFAAEPAKPVPPAVTEQINLASKLADYGVAHNDPLLLIAAARVMKTMSPAAAAAQKLSPDDMLKKAKELAGNRQDLKELADDVAAESSKGLCPGPGTVYGCF